MAVESRVDDAFGKKKAPAMGDRRCRALHPARPSKLPHAPTS
jgi:hypothetical protein